MSKSENTRPTVTGANQNEGRVVIEVSEPSGLTVSQVLEDLVIIRELEKTRGDDVQTFLNQQADDGMFWEPTMDILRARHAVDQGGRVYAKLTRPDGAGKTHLRPEGVVSE